MPLSGVFFVSLHHQSNRMTMFKKTDPNPQLDIFTAPSMQLGSRASKSRFKIEVQRFCPSIAHGA